MTIEIARSDQARLEPLQSGSLGSQTAPPMTGDVHGPAPTGRYGNVGAMLTTHADSKSVAVVQIAVASYTDAVDREHTLKSQLEHAHGKLESLGRESAEKDTRIAVLQERETQRIANTWMEKLCLLAGGALGGAAVTMAIEPSPKIGLLVGVIAVAAVLIIVGVRINAAGSKS